MSGVANIQTLYTQDGQPVQVTLIDGQHRLVVHDPIVSRQLEEMKMLLGLVISCLGGEPP